MNCPICGFSNQDQALFCQGCGKMIRDQTPKVQRSGAFLTVVASLIIVSLVFWLLFYSPSFLNMESPETNPNYCNSWTANGENYRYEGEVIITFSRLDINDFSAIDSDSITLDYNYDQDEHNQKDRHVQHLYTFPDTSFEYVLNTTFTLDIPNHYVYIYFNDSLNEEISNLVAWGYGGYDYSQNRVFSPEVPSTASISIWECGTGPNY